VVTDINLGVWYLVGDSSDGGTPLLKGGR